MAGLLRPHLVDDQRAELLVGGAGPQGTAQVHLGPGEEAVAQLAVGGEPHAVTGPAEGGGDAGDDPHRGRTTIDEEELGRSTAARGHRGQREALSQPLEEFGLSDHETAIPRMLGVERHLLDEAEFITPIEAPLQEIGCVDVVDAPHGHGIDLDRGEPGVSRRGEPGEDVGDPVAPGEAAKMLGVGRVEADVDPVKTCSGQGGCGAFEADAVGRHGDPWARVDGRNTRDKVDEGSAQQGFTAGEADLLDAQVDHDRDQPEQLRVGEHLRLGHPVQPLGRHAIGAAQVAAIGHRDTEIATDSAEAVEEAGLGSSGHQASNLRRVR